MFSKFKNLKKIVTHFLRKCFLPIWNMDLVYLDYNRIYTGDTLGLIPIFVLIYVTEVYLYSVVCTVCTLAYIMYCMLFGVQNTIYYALL